MSTDRPTQPTPGRSTDLEGRYGGPRHAQRRVIIALVTVVAALFLGWLGWVMWSHSEPAVESELIGFTVRDEHEVEARVFVTLREAESPQCLLRAMSLDHSTVGEVRFTPVKGMQSIAIRTERKATSVEKVGCTAQGQSRPR